MPFSKSFFFFNISKGYSPRYSISGEFVEISEIIHANRTLTSNYRQRRSRLHSMRFPITFCHKSSVFIISVVSVVYYFSPFQIFSFFFFFLGGYLCLSYYLFYLYYLKFLVKWYSYFNYQGKRRKIRLLLATLKTKRKENNSKIILI